MIMKVFSWRIGMGKVCLLLGLCFFSQMIFPQETDYSSVPVSDALRRPERGEAPRYPEDLVIGELGQGSAPLGAYQLAQEFLSALVRNAPSLERYPIATESASEEIRGINAGSYRIGGGRREPDGSVSFLVRFIGRDESITGELFVRSSVEYTGESGGEDEGTWRLDDLILEDKIPLSSIRDDYRYDFSPYERFF